MKKTAIMLFAAMGMMLASCSESTPAEEPKVDDAKEDNSSNSDLDDDPRFFEYSETDKQVLNGVNDFSFKLIDLISKNYEEAINKPDGNFVFSPVTESLMLAMLANAGDATLQTQLLNVLGVDNIHDLNATSAKMMRVLPSETSGGFLTIANSVWALPGSTITDDYMKILSEVYNAEYGIADFNTQQGIDLVNHWVATATKDKIRQILYRPSRDLEATWVSALTFEGEWYDKFDKSLTTDAEFFGTKEKSTVRMMHKTYSEGFAIQKPKYTIAKINFSGPADLFIVLPSENSDVDEVIESMEPSIFDTNFNIYKINLSLPQIDLATEMELNPVLSAMGVNPYNVKLANMQTPRSDGGKIIHFAEKSMLHIDEDGASAASVAYGGEVGSDGNVHIRPTIDMTVNRPFLFFFRNQRTGNIILAGRVCNL